MLIDDQKDTLTTLAEFLRATDGITIVGTALDQAHASQLVAKTQPDIVFLDLDFIQGMSGAELVPVLHDDCPAAKLVVLSSYEDPEVARGLLDLGVFAFVPKKSIAQIVVRLREIVTEVARSAASKRH